MDIPKFEEKELIVKETVNGFFGPIPVYDFPVSPKENYVALMHHRKPCWIPSDYDELPFCPSVIPDDIARGLILEGGNFPAEQYGGRDMFGVEWKYVPVVGGSMVVPGTPLLEDVNDWKDSIIFPDIDSWDWEGNAEKNREYLSTDRAVTMALLNGCWFERLISFMDFEGAALAVIDPDQRDALLELLHETTSLYIRIADKCINYFNIDGFSIHDDWGSQMAPFFSDAVAREVFLPEMKRFCSHIHSKGKYIDLHSCGHVEDRCGIFVEAGFDSWQPMNMNDTAALYDKYGDKIVIGVSPQHVYDRKEYAKEAPPITAKEFVQRFSDDQKYCLLSVVNSLPDIVTPSFREELYRYSRIRYSN